MPETLLQREVKTKRIATIGYRAAQALNDPVRVKILEIISHKPMSAEEIARSLASNGYKKATTTVRHHLQTLKDAALVETTRMVEVRGAVMKYYAPTLKAFSYEIPFDLEERHAKLIDETSSRLFKIIRNIHDDKRFLGSLEKENGSSCNLCKVNHFREYLAFEIVNSALARLLDRKEYAEILVGSKEVARASVARK
jgi:DNA-binding transcriptional ArsR family regulator